MSNLTAISNKDSIKIDFGVYKNPPYNLKSPFIIMKSNIEEFYKNEEGGIELITKGRNNHTMYLSQAPKMPYKGNPKYPYLIVDSVNNTVPTDIDHLIELIFNCFD